MTDTLTNKIEDMKNAVTTCLVTALEEKNEYMVDKLIEVYNSTRKLNTSTSYNFNTFSIGNTMNDDLIKF